MLNRVKLLIKPKRYKNASLCKLATVVCAVLLRGPMAFAKGEVAGICDIAARHASQISGVPLEILYTLTRVETGVQTDGVLMPWPWAANVAGKSEWFTTKAEATRHIEELIGTGSRNVDIGCFQLNHKWHGDAFVSVEDMIDPNRNAVYAADLLIKNFKREGTWLAAIAAYHSTNPAMADVYIARFKSILADMEVPASDDRGGLVRIADGLRENRFPLLRSGPVATPGSITPQYVANTRLIGENP